MSPAGYAALNQPLPTTSAREHARIPCSGLRVLTPQFQSSTFNVRAVRQRRIEDRRRKTGHDQRGHRQAVRRQRALSGGPGLRGHQHLVCRGRRRICCLDDGVDARRHRLASATSPADASSTASSSASSGVLASCAPMIRRRSRRIIFSSCPSKVSPSRSASLRSASRVRIETSMVAVSGILLRIPSRPHPRLTRHQPKQEPMQLVSPVYRRPGMGTLRAMGDRPVAFVADAGRR